MLLHPKGETYLDSEDCMVWFQPIIFGSLEPTLFRYGCQSKRSMLQRYAAIAGGNAAPTVIRKDMCWFASQRRNADTVMAMDVFIVDIPAGRMC